MVLHPSLDSNFFIMSHLLSVWDLLNREPQPQNLIAIAIPIHIPVLTRAGYFRLDTAD
jgi:hypothetical protein